MRASPLGTCPVPSSAVLHYLRSQLKSPCARSTALRSHWSAARPAAGQETRVAKGWRGHSLKQRHGTLLPKLDCAIWSGHWSRRHDPSAARYHAFSTLTNRHLPREIAHRNAPNDRWCTRRPSTVSASPLGLSPSISSSSPHAAALSFLDDPAGLAGPRLTKPHPDQRLRCTEFDEAGNVTVVNGEFRKSELIQKYGLQPRDLRKIDSSLLPTILVRPRAILLNLLHIRCLIQADRVLVFDAYGSTDSYTQSLFMYDLEGKLSLRSQGSSGQYQQQHLAYEFRALEAVLISVTTALEGEFEGVRGPVVKVLRDLEENIDRDKLRMLLVLSKKIGTFEQRARLVRDAIDELLEADDDLAAMYLTEKRKGTERDDEDHTEIEMLLESYDKVCDEIVQASGNLVANIRNTEEIVKAILDANRNSLMLLDLKFSIGTLGIGAGTFIAALYGMNLKSFIEEWDLGFPLVSLTCALFTVVACMYGFRKLRKVQRLSMWGEGDVDAMQGSPGDVSSGMRWNSRGGWRGLGGRDCSDGSPAGGGRDEWRHLQHVSERIDGLEKNQWAAAIRLRKLRLAERENAAAAAAAAASSSASSAASASAQHAASKTSKK